MSDTTDAVIGAVPGILAVGIMADVAGKMLNPRKVKAKKQKAFNNLKNNKSIW